MHISPGSSLGDIKNNGFPFDSTHLACYDRNHRLCGLNINFSRFWKLGSSWLRSLQVPCLVRPLPALKLSIFSLCLHMVDGARVIIFLTSLLRKALILFMRAPPSWTDIFPEGPTSKYQHIHDWLSDTNLQFTNVHSLAPLTGIPEEEGSSYYD